MVPVAFTIMFRDANMLILNPFTAFGEKKKAIHSKFLDGIVRVCFFRERVLKIENMRELNAKLARVARVVVHPKYRTIGAL